MYLSKTLRGALCAAPLLFAGCGDSESSFDLELVHMHCDAQKEDVFPTSGVIQISITGDGIGSPITATADVAARQGGSLDVPEIPPGSNRVATVRVSDRGSGGSAGTLRAFGRSAPFSVSESDTPHVQIQMYRVNGFTRTRGESGACSSLETERAGHTATLLKDGRVLVAGGYRILASGSPTEVLASAEIFDPATGAFTAAGDMCADGTCLPRAFGQAVALQDGRVLIVGGVDDTGTPTSSAIVFDPRAGGWVAAPSMAHARRGHSATRADGAGGRVVIVGGVDESGEVQNEIEFFDPRSGSFNQVKGTALGRAFHQAAVVGADQKGVQVVGGFDVDGKLELDAPVVRYDQGKDSFIVVATSGGVGKGVAGAGIAPFSKRIAVIGGATKWVDDGSRPGGFGAEATGDVQWFDREGGTGAKGKVAGKTARLDPCVAMLDADRALVVGGFATNGTTPLANAEVVDAKGDQVSSSATEKEGALRDLGGRGHATCTALDDRRVLVVGGIGSGGKAVQTAEIYVALLPADLNKAD